jgi:hypothetical protein
VVALRGRAADRNREAAAALIANRLKRRGQAPRSTSIWTRPTTAPHSLQRSSTLLPAAMMQPQQSTAVTDSCGTMAVWLVMWSLSSRSDPDTLAAVLAGVGSRLMVGGQRIHLSAVRTRRFLAVQTEQALHDIHLHDTYNVTAFVTTQFHVGVFHDSDNASGAIHTSEPMQHPGHQAGEFIAELAIHRPTLNTLQRAGGLKPPCSR